MLRRTSLGLSSVLVLVAACGARVSPDRDALVLADATVVVDVRDVPMDRVELGDARPAVDVVAVDSATCAALNEHSIRAPSVVVSGERVPLAATALSAGCGCRPTVVTRGARDYALRACDCSLVDPCVDPPYVVHWDDAATTSVRDVTPERIRIGTLVANITRLPPDYRCAGGETRIEPGGVMIETDNSALTSGPRRVWAFVRGTALRCSGNPLVLVTASGSSPIMLTAADCNNTDCDGPTSPRTFGVWTMLGEFVPGTYSIFYSPGVSQRFIVR